MIPAPVQNLLNRLSVAWHERAIALKAASFAVVGVVNTGIDFSIFWMTARWLGWPGRLSIIGMPAASFSAASAERAASGPLRYRYAPAMAI